jgi:hypothetical protein
MKGGERHIPGTQKSGHQKMLGLMGRSMRDLLGYANAVVACDALNAPRCDLWPFGGLPD